MGSYLSTPTNKYEDTSSSTNVLPSRSSESSDVNKNNPSIENEEIEKEENSSKKFASNNNSESDKEESDTTLSTPKKLASDMSSKEEEEEVVMFRDGDNVSKVKAGTKKLIIDKSVRNVPQGYRVTGRYSWRSPFPGYETIEEIVIKKGVKSIGKLSFGECKKLKKITLPSTLEEIGEWAFFSCENLKEVNLSNTKITHINKSTFYLCKKLNSIILPSTLVDIGEQAFYLCTNLEEVDLSKTKITRINTGTFNSCEQLKSIIFPSKLKDIGICTFENCENLTSLKIPESVTWIEKAAFAYCGKLIVVNFLSTSTKVHKDAFMGCDALPSFIYKNNIKASTETTENKAAEIKDKLTITENVEKGQYRMNDTIRVVKVEEGVERIGQAAFQGCTSLESIQLPKSLQKIGIGAFRGCTSLREINIPDDVTVIQWNLFDGCTSLKHVTLSPSITKIESWAFHNCTSLKNIELPQTLEYTGDYAFWCCKSLKKIAIPKSVKELGPGVFLGCTSLEEVTFEKDSEIKIINPYTFQQCSSLREIELPSTVIEIEHHAFSECSSLKYINIHDNITIIGKEAFAGCTSLESISIPRSVNKISKDAFRGCTSLREVTIQNPDIEIEEGAFAKCDALENIRGLPSSYRNIKSYLDKKVFEGCLSLENPIGNEIHLAAEGKCWKEVEFPQDGLLWIQRELEKANSKSGRKDASFMKDHNGNTVFECAVRGGAPESYLNVLAKGEDKDGKTHLDIFAEINARKKPEDFTPNELAFLIELNSKLTAATSIGEGRNYINSLEELLQSPIFDPRKVPEFIHILNNKFKSKRFAFLLMLEFIIPVLRILSFVRISDVYFDDDEGRVDKAHIVWFVLMNYFNIIWTLVPFFLVSFFMLGAFAHMYFINDRTTGTYPDFWTSFLQTSSNLLSFDGLPFYNTVDVSFESTTVVLDEANSKNKNEMTISYFFGIFVVILLSNVLIAVLSATWEDVSERGRDKFLLYRVRLLLETQKVFDFFDTIDKKDLSIKSISHRNKIKTCSLTLSPDANYKIMWGESKKFSEVLLRMNPVLFGRVILNIIYTVLGIFFGLTWPTAVRKALFCIDNSDAITDKRNGLQTRLRETKREVERLSKIDKHITMKPDDMYAYLIDCEGIPSHFELKKKIGALEKMVKKQKNDVENFKNWEESLKGAPKERKKEDTT